MVLQFTQRTSTPNAIPNQGYVTYILRLVKLDYTQRVLRAQYIEHIQQLSESDGSAKRQTKREYSGSLTLHVGLW